MIATLTRTDTLTDSGGRYYRMPYRLVAGKRYTWSVCLKGNGRWQVGPEQGGQRIIDLTEVWIRYTHSFIAKDHQYYQFTFYRIQGQTGGQLSLHSIHLVEGERIVFDWSPAPEDLTTNVQFSQLKQTVDSISAQVTNKVDKTVYDSFVQQTAKSLASKVSQGEYDSNNNLINQRFSSITQTAQGLQTQVNNNKGNISTVTQLANALQSRMSNAEGNISTLTQTASSLQSTITSVRNDLNGLEIGGRNLIAGTDFTSTNGFSTWTNIGTVSVVTDDRYLGRNYLKWESKKPNGEDIAIRAGAALGIEFKRNRFSVIKGEEYTLSFIIASNEFNGLLDYTYLMHGDGGPNLRLKAINTNGYPKYKPFQASSDIHYHVVSHTFKADRTDDNCYFLIAAILKRELNGSNGYAWFRIFNLQLEKGNKATDWTPAPEDMATQSQISQLSNAINLRVQKGDVINQINIDTSGILIAGQKVHITGQTKIDNAVIKTAMIANAAVGTAAIANAAITRAKLGTASVGTAQIENGAITNAKIANLSVDSAKIANGAITNAKIATLSADKITSGIINANLVTLAVKNGVQSIQLDNTGLRSIDSNGKMRIHLGVRNIGGAGQSDPATIRFFSGNGSVSAGIGMNVNGHFIIGSTANTAHMELYSGGNIITYSRRFRISNLINYPYLDIYPADTEMQSDGTRRKMVVIEPSVSARGNIGREGVRMWRIYTNYLHYIDLVNMSSRDNKTNIKDADVGYLQFVFENMDVVTFNYKNEDGSSRTDELKVGWIAEDSPSLITSKDKKQISLNNTVGVIAGSLKFQTSRIDQLENEFEWLKIENQYLKQKINQLEEKMA
ncbi:putative nucleic acid-binding Zn-ribbon protein [Bacillus thermophilus]|uniref:Nucleic acid-binding Zn-ribbon protein n=1 Tax=Siminovitchia thermophila TaxID=1245522 RepID=A0ABS2RCW6_9BACI|nr:tail fiber domain-containing protein [Siminovitchia thermophila]MBM7717230.1 putative nucleic acid-binding Zn-ribbon protein [Siminovitchia thermophila]ONK23001.1 hypothetical protein BLX87_12990 [Bacillus sp. VT-16-64]